MAARTTTAGVKLFGWIMLAALALLILKWALITVAILIVPFGIWWIWDRARASRGERTEESRTQAALRRWHEIESRAAVDATGGCGWCGSRLAHRDDRGETVHPREHHRAEIDEQLRSATVRG
jgi:ABC-type nickel/cobalt efflux system permease component RcnA